MRYSLFGACIATLAMALAVQGCTTVVHSVAGAHHDQPVLDRASHPLLSVDGRRFRDLDRNGALTPYEDWRLSPEQRTTDLVSRMTDAELAGTMMHGSLVSSGGLLGDASGEPATGYDLDLARQDISALLITSFITRLSVNPATMGVANNRIQAIAMDTRLGIPLTISTDPRNHFQAVLGASTSTNGYSQWPEMLGLAALRDPALTRRFASIASAEYRASGIHMALSPQADLFTEPRWSRGTGTFGSDAALAGAQVQAYVQGFQGAADGLARTGVSTVVKHWVGYGAAPEGFDGHNYYGRFSRLDNAALDYHIAPFLGAFDSGVAGVMPTYNILVGPTIDAEPLEPVAAGFNAQVLGLLRHRYAFAGMVLSDWAITRDCNIECSAPTQPHGFAEIAMPWGVESLSLVERFAKGINAGIDQFGGVTEPDMVLAALEAGLVSHARIEQAAANVLVIKFRLGLFENAMVDPAMAASVSGPGVVAEAHLAQAQAQVLVKNDGALLPLAAGTKVWLRGIDPVAASAAGLVPVERIDDADVALVRASTPFERLHPFHFFGARQNEGRLDFRPGDPDYDAVRAASAAVPVIVALFADRPPVLAALEPHSRAILLNFGISDSALLDVVTGKVEARGQLPFQLPPSAASVERQNPALPDDAIAP